jgi:hypothetical protein
MHMRVSEARSAGKARVRLVVAIGLLLAVCGIWAAQASGAANGGTAVVFHRVHSRAHLRAFWTPQRIRHAKPLSVIRRGRPGGGLLAAPGHRILDAAGPGARGIDTGDPTAFPNRVNGVVAGEFDFGPFNVEQFQCSGSVLNTSAGNVVLTAAHCLVDADTGMSASNLVFVPGFRDGTAPFGEWPATSFVVPAQWQNSVGPTHVNPGDEAGDMGMMRIAGRSDGATVQTVVGAAGIAFNQARNQTYMQYGYPAESPYDGSRLYENTSALRATDTTFSPPTMGISSDFTPGSSGGPWLVGCFPVALSVTDYSYTDQPDVMYGPYFGSIAEGLFTSVGGSASGSPATASAGCANPASSSRRPKIKKIVRNRRRGTALIRLSIPAAGSVTLHGPGVRRVVKHPAHGGVIGLAIRARGGAVQRLRRRGAAQVKVTLSYVPTGGSPVALTRRIALLRR